ncbi:hypothetical protein NPIL_255471, partial [Nephila pilipes]
AESLRDPHGEAQSSADTENGTPQQTVRSDMGSELSSCVFRYVEISSANTASPEGPVLKGREQHHCPSSRTSRLL